jgi:prophage antirepressor-like protein
MRKAASDSGEKIAIFKGKEVRRTLFNKEWWFSIVDICTILTDSPDGGAYWRKLKQRLNEEGNEVVTFCHGLKLAASDGKQYITDCANTEGIFRIIQSIPSPKAEPFKRWLAKVGYERIQEIEDPELAAKRMRATYKAKGYSDKWIDLRMRGMVVRADLVDEWDNRGVKEEKEYAILTAEISQATFGMTPTEYKKFKGLKRENLRDHMDDLELLFSMLGEASTSEIAKVRNVQGMAENKKAAKQGGKIAGDARKKLEIETGKRVVKRDNYLGEPEGKKKLFIGD